MLDPQNTPYTSSLQASYGVLFLNICEKIDRVVTAPHCNSSNHCHQATWCNQAASHYLNQCRPRPVMLLVVTRLQWFDEETAFCFSPFPEPWCGRWLTWPPTPTTHSKFKRTTCGHRLRVQTPVCGSAGTHAPTVSGQQGTAGIAI